MASLLSSRLQGRRLVDGIAERGGCGTGWCAMFVSWFCPRVSDADFLALSSRPGPCGLVAVAKNALVVSIS